MSNRVEMDNRLHDLIAVHRAWLDRETDRLPAPILIPNSFRENRLSRQRGIAWVVAYGLTLAVLVIGHLLWLTREPGDRRGDDLQPVLIELFPAVVEQNIARAWLEVSQ